MTGIAEREGDGDARQLHHARPDSLVCFIHFHRGDGISPAPLWERVAE